MLPIPLVLFLCSMRKTSLSVNIGFSASQKINGGSEVRKYFNMDTNLFTTQGLSCQE